jgi:hypothetical protein
MNNGLFTFDDSIEDRQSAQHVFATKLANTLIGNRLTIRPINLAKWIEVFRKLIIERGAERVKIALSQHCANLSSSNGTIPLRVFSANSFQQRFLEIERYYSLHTISTKKVPKECKYAIEQLQKNYVWPNGESKNVPTFVISTYENYLPFYDSVRAIVKNRKYSKSENGKRREYYHFLRMAMKTFFLKAPENWLLVWGMLVNEKLHRGYCSQNLLRHIWQIDNPLFSIVASNRMIQYFDHSYFTLHELLLTFEKFWQIH